MKTIIAGSRNIISLKVAKQVIRDSGFIITEVVSGMARGADTLGEEYAYHNGIIIKRFKPDWTGLGKKAGILRNIDMGNYAQALIALWNGKSVGTKHMINYATKKGLKIYVGNIVVIETDDVANLHNINKILNILNHYKQKGLIKEHDIIVEDQKINISYTPGDYPEIERELRRIIEK